MIAAWLNPAFWPAANISMTFIELGAAVLGLALLTRLANRLGFSAIPLYLLAGLAFGNGGLLPLDFSEDFIHVGAEIGVVLLLFMLGLEYTGEELRSNLRTGIPGGMLDFVLNFTPGALIGFAYGFSPLPALLLGGVTYISSSAIIARVLTDLHRMENPETPTILSILVIEDLAMAVYLPLVSVLLIGQGFLSAVLPIFIAILAVALVLIVAIRFGARMSQSIQHESDEVILLSLFGVILLAAGIAQNFRISTAVGAFLVGIAVSGPVVSRAHQLLKPLRDLFAGVFFLFFGLQIAPMSLPPVLVPALVLALVTALTKILTGWWAARRAGVDVSGRIRAGIVLVSRGEFSIVIAGLGVSAGLDARLGFLAAAYVLILAILGPILVRLIDPKS